MVKTNKKQPTSPASTASTASGRAPGSDSSFAPPSKFEEASKFEEGPTFRSVRVAPPASALLNPEVSDRRAEFQHSPTLFSAPPTATSATFTLPDTKILAVGGRSMLPSPLAPPASSQVIAPPPPGVEGITSSLITPPSATSMLFFPTTSLPLLVATTNQILAALNVDFDLERKRARWTCVSSLDCTFMRFEAQVYELKTGSHVLEIARREGDAITFRKVANILWEGLTVFTTTGDLTTFISTLASHSLLQGLKPLPDDLFQGKPGVDAESLSPLLEMAQSSVIDQQLYAAQVTAKLVRSSVPTRQVIGSSALLSHLITTTTKIDMSCPLPLEHAILRHVAFTLAACSEDSSSHGALMSAGALPFCFRLVAGALGDKDDSCSCSALDVESRREAARCLAIMLAPAAQRKEMIESLEKNLDNVAGEMARWQEFRGTIKDERLRARCDQISRYISAN